MPFRRVLEQGLFRGPKGARRGFNTINGHSVKQTDLSPLVRSRPMRLIPQLWMSPKALFDRQLIHGRREVDSSIVTGRSSLPGGLDGFRVCMERNPKSPIDPLASLASRYIPRFIGCMDHFFRGLNTTSEPGCEEHLRFPQQLILVGQIDGSLSNLNSFFQTNQPGVETK